MPEPTPTPAPRVDVQGRCPACGGASLFLGDGGYVTCNRLKCPEPDAASTVLERKPEPAPANTAPRCTCGHPRADHSAPRKAADLPRKYKYWCHGCEFGCVYCPADDTQPAVSVHPHPDHPCGKRIPAELREQYAAAINYALLPVTPRAEYRAHAASHAAAAVLAVRDTELQQLREQIAQVHAECERIEAAVRANPQDPDFDGAYLAAIGHIRRALDSQPGRDQPASDR